MAGRARRAGVPGSPDPGRACGGPARPSPANDLDAAATPCIRARRGVSMGHDGPDGGRAGRRRPDREGPPPPVRRCDDRVGPDALPGARRSARAAHAVHLQPGRLRGGLPVLRDRRARLQARPARPPRSSTRSGPPRARLAARGAVRLTNVVFMGMGEPLLNLDRVLEAVAALNDRSASGSGRATSRSPRRGSCPGIRRLTELGAAVHARDQPPRSPRCAARRARARSTGAGRSPRSSPRRATTPARRAAGQLRSGHDLGGVNDTDLDADAVADLLRGDLAHVNLIPMNPVAHTPWQASPPDAVIERFAARLRAVGHRPSRSGATAARRSARRAASSRPRTGRGPAPAAVAWRRERLEAASARALLGERSDEPVAAWRGRPDDREPPGRGRHDAARTGPGRREHPRRRPRQPRQRGQARGARGRGPDPPRRHGRPLRPEPHLRSRRPSRRSGAGPRSPSTRT